MRRNMRGINRCMRCSAGSDSRKGGSQIEHTQRGDGYVMRTRACVDCGGTWTTAEVSTLELRRLRKIERLLDQLVANTRKPARGGPSKSKEHVPGYPNGSTEDRPSNHAK